MLYDVVTIVNNLIGKTLILQVGIGSEPQSEIESVTTGQCYASI